MLWYKLKLSFRSLAKDKLNSIINIFGLAVGMAAVILISIYVQHELSYDKFNTKQERIYKLISLLNETGEELTPYEICLRLTNENFASQIPEIEEITQLYNGYTQNAKVGDKNFTQIRCIYVDTNFHKVFSLKPISGQSTNLFSKPNGFVINATTALKLFGTTNAEGKEFEMFGGNLCTVSAVVEDLPLTSSYDFDMLLPFSGFPRKAGYQSLEYFTYILVKQGIDRNSTIKKIEDKYTKMLDDRLGEYGMKTGSYLQKLSDIHLRSNYQQILKPGGNINTIYIHILLAFLILIIAMINFINIITVQYDGKLNQIGIKKAIGAERIDLIKDFLGRTTLMSVIALLFGVILAEILMPFFGSLMNRELAIDYLSNPLLFIGLPVMALFVGLISGLYPAITITRYTPASIIKGKLPGNHGTNLLSRILVIFQFSASIILISAVIISQQQIDYMKNADLGFDTEQVIAINNLSQIQTQAYSSIKQELLKIPQISFVSASLHLPGGGGSGQIFRLYGTDIKNTKDYNEYRVRPGYFKTLGIQFVEGNTFTESQVENCKGIILNEAAVKYLNVDDPLGRIVWFHEDKYEIQGIVKDFHYASLQEKIAPLMFTCFSDNRNIQFVLLKVKTNNMTDLLGKIKDTFKKVDPERVNYHMFIDDVCRDRYQTEERSQILTGYSSALSIILALLGLYSLTLFMVQKRTKEIGIRKVTGASISQISLLLFSNFLKWIAIAFMISIPVSYYIMQHWLEQFAYHITIGPLPFVFAGLLTAIFALLVVGGQTWKAANQNPVDSLRSE
ncbi:ABC transporter permease [Labilibaculum sp. K2S]|uniref:ABC transporter permease n=1 Tax=Labilibaculum sp. K2S TaxID=3056386 RepID=UPI0025A4438A|nr:ABC transporter permease [Labilibaculum sp. K2S]MDM8159837.1 ABC transporter permease [Labilibaculum sp. K2S]